MASGLMEFQEIVSVALFALFQVLVRIWEVITFPIYELAPRLLKGPKDPGKQPYATRIDTFSSAHEVVYKPKEKNSMVKEEFSKSRVDTVDKAWSWAVERYRKKSLLGTREILKIEDEVQSNGRIFKKYHLGDYRWITYEDADAIADYVGKSLRAFGMNRGDNVCIFSETREEWFLMAQACFKQAFPIVTLYANLGEKAVAHGITLTESQIVITSHDLLSKFRTILKDAPCVRKIVYFEHQVERTNVDGFPPEVEVLPFYDLVHSGKKLSRSPAVSPVGPGPLDTAVIMFTSGSTGLPKGVVLSHRNVLFALTSFMATVNFNIIEGEAMIAFLPLAHIFELTIESAMLMFGIRLGYSSPNTLTDRSSMVKRGCKGDATILRPTRLIAVPLILDRVYSGIKEVVAKKGPTSKNIFDWAFEYRLQSLKKGRIAPILDWFFTRYIGSLLGGRVQTIFVGGAPLSAETQDFVRVCFNAVVLQGYGLTETCSCATVTDLEDNISVGVVGAPVQGVQIKLIDWEEGNYKVTDHPRPRGEVVIGGGCVAEGYYKMKEKTEEDFYEQYGRRWFRTGDIGEVDEFGYIRIIDRKKDLVKLQFGEYLSLGKVEIQLSTCAIIENVCVFADPSKCYCVALVCPDRKALLNIAMKFNKAEMSFEELCEDMEVTGAALREIVKHCKIKNLEKFEIPGALTLVKDVWTPDNGLLTASMKIKRKAIQQAYQCDIDRMYGIFPQSTGSPA